MFQRKGFSLIELTLVLGVGASLAFMKFQDMVKDQEFLKSNAAGQQIKQLGEAINGYINIRYDKLSTLTASTGTGTDPGPRTCVTSTSTCTITYQTLMNEGLLPANYSVLNSFGSDYTIQLKRNGTNPNYVIDGLVFTNSAWIEGGKTRYDLLGKAMQTAGIDSGMSKSSTKIDGYGGGWSYSSSDFASINKTGVLGYRVGYNSAMYSVYLRRDGTLPMTGDLNMGSNDINNAVNINASGTTTSGILKSTGATNVGTNLTVATTGIFGGTVAVAGKSVTDMPTGWSGLRTQDVVGSGTIAVGTPNGSSSTWKTYMNSSGNIYASNNITSASTINASGRITGGDIYSNSETYTTNWFRTLGDGGIYFQKYGGGFYMTDTATINAYAGKNIQTTAGLYGSYVRSSGTIDASGNVNANYFYPTSTSSSGAGCAPNGLISKDGSGKLLYCYNGVWSNSLAGDISSNSFVLGFTGTVNLGQQVFCAIGTYRSDSEDDGQCQVYKSGSNWYITTSQQRYVGCAAVCMK